MAVGWRPMKLPLLALMLQALAFAASGLTVPDAKACIGQVREFDVCPDLPECFERIPCTFAPWDEWRYEKDCTGLCFRERQVKEYSNKYGAPCSGPIKTSKDCTDLPEYISACSIGLPTTTGRVDCHWTTWSAWSGCTAKCGGGEARRERHITGVPQHGGAPCSPEVMEEVTPCNTQSCDECVDGMWSDWGEWGVCSASCGAGMAQRQRDISVPENKCGRPLIGSANEFRPCHTVVCPEAKALCSLGSWHEWGACTASCGMGRRERVRNLEAVHMNIRNLTNTEDWHVYAQRLEQMVWQLQEDSAHLESKSATMRENISGLEQQVSALLDEKRSDASAAADAAVDSSAVIASLKEKLRAANSREPWAAASGPGLRSGVVTPSPSPVVGAEVQRQEGNPRFDDSEELRMQATRNRALVGGLCVLFGVLAFYFWYGQRSRNTGTVLGSAPDAARSSGPGGAMALQGARAGME